MLTRAGTARRWIASFAATFVVACSGGGGGGDAAPTAIDARVPLASAVAPASVPGGATLTLDGSGSTDPDRRALTYRWTLSERPANSTAVLTAAATAKPTFTADREGSYAATLTVNNGVADSAPATVRIAATQATALEIVADQTEPVSDAVNLRLSDTTVASPVTWYVDLIQAATGPVFTWMVNGLPNATHLVLARVQVAPNVYVEARRTIAVANSSVTLSSTISGTSGPIEIYVRARSPYAITRVSATLDGAPLDTLTAPNACEPGGFLCANRVFHFTVDGARAGSGDHTVVVDATDASGSTRRLVIPVPVSNAPAVVLDTPADADFVYGTLRVSGTAASDKTGPVTVTASLGDVPFLTTTQPAFDGTYDLTGVVPGSYTMTLRATDSTGVSAVVQRMVVVASSSALAYRPLLALGDGGELLAVSGDRVLFRDANQNFRVRDTATGVETTLQGADTTAYAANWQIDDANVVVSGKRDDCAINFVCVYRWDAAGAVENLSTHNPAAGTTYQSAPVLHDGRVAWANDAKGGSYTLFDTRTRAYAQITPAPEINRPGNWRFDFTVAGGNVQLVYWGLDGPDPTSSLADTYRWDSSTNISTRLSTPGSQSIYPMTDGVRVAWLQGGLTGTPSLVVRGLSAGAPSVAATAVDPTFYLQDGVLAWVEVGTPGIRPVRASTQSATSTLTTSATSALYGAGGGWVTYLADGRVQSWNAATATSTLRVDVAPREVKQSGSTLYFTVGPNRSLYKVPLR